MSFTRDPGAAMMEALVVYLAAALSSYTVIRGWPETDQAIDLTHPVVSVFQAGALTDEPCNPAIADAATVVLGQLVIAVQIDVWAAYRETLDAAVLAVSNALHNALPYRPGLYLTATDYSGRTFVVSRTGDGPEADGETAALGQWRHTFSLTASIERVSPVGIPVAVTIDTPVNVS